MNDDFEYVQVLVDIAHLDTRTFSYKITDDLKGKIKIGQILNVHYSQVILLKNGNQLRNNNRSILDLDLFEKEIECIDQKKLIEEYKKKVAMPINPICKQYNINNQKCIESKPSGANETKLELLSSLVKELKIKCNIYEKYLRSNGIEPENVLKQYNYTGVVPPKSATFRGTQGAAEMGIQSEGGLSESNRYDNGCF